MEKTILIVEDDKDIQSFYEMILTGLNVKILKAYNGKEALKFIGLKKHIDLIILDLIMPDMDGMEFLEIIRKKKKISVPVILSTVDDIWADKLLKSGDVQDFFNKMDGLKKLKKMVKKNINS